MIMTSQYVSFISENIVNLYQASFKFSNVDTNTVIKKKLNIKKATGYDGLSTQLIKIAYPKLVTSLTHMINRCINDCVFQMANVSLVFKSKDVIYKEKL